MTQLHTLHQMYTKDVLMPKFASQFQCIGSECSLSCCTYFDVFLKKRDYDILEKKVGLTAEQKKNYKKYSKSKRTENRYAEFIGREGSKNCGFFEKGLCSLHRDFGEAALPGVCYIYPRIYRLLGRQYTELNLHLSCPSASNLALLQEDAFDFVIRPMTFRKDVVVQNLITSGDPQWILDIQFFCIQLIRTKEIDLWKRVAFLGLFYSQLDEVFAHITASKDFLVSQKTLDGVRQNISQLITASTALVESGEVNTIYDTVEEDSQYLISCVTFFLRIRDYWESNNSGFPFIQLIKEIESRLSSEGERLREGGVYDFFFLNNNYRQGLKNLKNSLKNHPWFFEHLLLSELMYLFLFLLKDNNIYYTYQHFCFFYLFMRFILAMYCVQNEKTPEELSFVVARIMRYMQHTNFYDLIDIIDFQCLGWENNLSAIYTHLKDEL